MNLSIETVRSYLKTIYEKLHVHCRTEAVMRYTAARPASVTLDNMGKAYNSQK